MRKAALLAALLAVLAGCSEAPAPGATPSPTHPELTVPAPEAILSGYDCQQAHQFFSAPAASLQPLLPEGFTVAEETPGTGSVVIYTTLCASLLAVNQSDATGEMWIGVAVVPPEAYADENLTLDLFPLTWIQSEADVVERLHALGFDARVQPGNVSMTQDTRVANNVVRSLVAQSANETFTFDATAAADGSSFPPALVRIWVGDAEGVTGSLLLANLPAASVAIGNVVFRYTGPDAGTPPVSDGIVHFVEGLEYSMRWVPVPPSPAA